MRETHEYVEKRMGKSPTTVYNFPNADANKIYSYLNSVYTSGSPASNGGMVVDTYFLIGNNCSTVTCGALQVGGVIIPTINSPSGFNDYMNSRPAPMTSSYISTLGQH